MIYVSFRKYFIDPGFSGSIKHNLMKIHDKFKEKSHFSL